LELLERSTIRVIMPSRTLLADRPVLSFVAGMVLVTACLSPGTPVGAGDNWAAYLGHPSSNQYSTLGQINKGNVDELEVAWTYDTGDSAEYQSNNLIVDGVLFTASPSRKVMALNGATGTHLWTFDPDELNPYGGSMYQGGGRQRGVMYWEGGDDHHIFTVKGPWLYALDAKTGEPISSFGDGGWIHLGDQMDVEGRPNVGLNTPGYVYHDLLIIGANVNEDVPGAIRAFDVRTGERKWIFHTLPRPGEPGSETWPDDYLAWTGGASDWSGIAVDTARGIVYASTESAGPDFYGGFRYGQNLFANSVVALDADTGEPLWHYQIVHHDLWDFDLPTPPTLLTVTHDGRRVDALAQGTKMGLLFVFDRVTGEPLWPIEERPAPESRLPDMRSWPTQPFPTRPAPLMRQKYMMEDASNISPEARQLTTETLQRDSSFGYFPPPVLTETIIFPGYDGGFEWGGSAADPDGILYVNINEIPWFYQLIPTKGPSGQPLPPGERLYRIHCASCHGLELSGSPGSGIPSLVDLADRRPADYVASVLTFAGARMPAFDQVPERQRQAIIDFLFGRAQPEAREPSEDQGSYAVNESPPYAFRGFQRWLDAEGYPAIKPPWGTLNAVDLNTGEIKWTVPLGEYEELTARGIPSTGTENYGGPVVTAGGLIFIGATADEKFRAFDKDTGEVMWEADLPFGGNATPSTYMVDGRQYVVISAGGGKSNRPAGGSIVAFALPD
jgi:quinoprotein glucose dehydrogenase